MNPRHRDAGFTLLEVILVLVLMAVVAGISIPYFAGALKGMKLTTAAREIERATRFSRSMAILREETLTMGIDASISPMTLFVGAPKEQTTETDGEINLDVLERLGYTSGNDSDEVTTQFVKELNRLLPDRLTIGDFEQDSTEENTYENVYLINFYPNGQCDWFRLVLQDRSGSAVEIEIDPISGRVRSEFIQ